VVTTNSDPATISWPALIYHRAGLFFAVSLT
jgi:hypothetical protein